jgi:DNA-binding PadR family transcriptional regulator
MTTATRKVLWALLDVEECYGLEVVHRTRLAGGTVYPILARLEEHGCVLSRWDCADPHTQGPRRRFYRITPTGLTLATNPGESRSRAHRM